MGSAMPGGPSTIGRVSSLAALALLAACAVVPPAPPPPPPPPSPPPSPPPPSPVAAAPEKAWDVAPLTPGDWTYSKLSTGTTAAFGSPASTDFSLRCNFPGRRITMVLVGYAGNSIAIRTSSGDFTWPAFGVNAEFKPAATSVTLPASDRAFDAIAYSRGRISVEVQGTARLIVPVWAEVSRVIEDCRG